MFLDEKANLVKEGSFRKNAKLVMEELITYCLTGFIPGYIIDNILRVNVQQTFVYFVSYGGDGCHLRVVPPGQLLRRPSTPKRFCLLPFIEPGFSIFCDVKFFCVCFPVVQGFSLRLLCLFRIVFSSNSLYILYIFIFIYFIYFFLVLVVPYSALTDYDRSVVLTFDDRPCVCSGFSLASWRWTGCPKETIAI